jgi:YVTN family beta-propeller protein
VNISASAQEVKSATWKNRLILQRLDLRRWQGDRVVVIVVDTASGTVRERIRLAGETRAGFKLFFAPDGSKLLTMGSGPAAPLHVFDTHDLHAAQKVIAVGRDPMGLAFAADGKTAVVANHGDGSISVIDLETMKVTGNYPAGKGIETLAWY